jgi:hypothetical protein
MDLFGGIDAESLEKTRSSILAIYSDAKLII